MAEIPSIEGEIDFHVEAAGKPCKTVCELLFIHCYLYFMSPPHFFQSLHVIFILAAF
jgi:hypothetical protein